MINVYFNSQDKENWIRLSPTGNNVVGNCNFIFDEKELKNYEKIDFLVVFNQYKKTEYKFNKFNTLVFACEPPSIKKYSTKYLNQFANLVSTFAYDHKNLINRTTFFPWHIGINRNQNLQKEDLNFNELKNINPKKKKMISLIRTAKSMCKEHDLRNKIFDSIINRFEDQIDVYGRDHKFISDKKEALLDYHYHICIENYFGNDFWTEKLSDPLIAKCNPIYLGCRNLKDYFNEKFYHLKLDDLDFNLRFIEKILKKKEHHFEFEDSRNLIFTKYNLFSFLNYFISANFDDRSTIKSINEEHNFINTKTLRHKFLGLFKI